MQYIVMDLEWNQGNAKREPEVYGVPFEVIEIGAIKLNEEKEMIGEFNELIKPQLYHEMHYVTKQLLHLQMRQLEKGQYFPKVYRKFRNWCGEDAIFCIWGGTDLTELQRNMSYYQEEPLANGPLKYYDVQKLFSIAFEDGKVRRSLEYAVDYLQIEKDIPFHRAFSDAYYTAKVLKRIQDDTVLQYYSYDTFLRPENQKEEIHVIFPTYSKYISREFEDRAKALEDKEVSACRCYVCHKNLRRKIKWFSGNRKHYYSVSKCDKHGYVKGKIRIRKTESGSVYVVKTEKFISEEEMILIQDKYEKVREQKRLFKQHQRERERRNQKNAISD